MTKNLKGLLASHPAEDQEKISVEISGVFTDLVWAIREVESCLLMAEWTIHDILHGTDFRSILTSMKER